MNAEKESLKALLVKEQAQRFKNYRKQLGLTQEQLAEALSSEEESIAPRTVIRWEQGSTPVPGWAISQLQFMVQYFSDNRSKKETKNAVLHALTDVTAGFFNDVKIKVKKILKG